MVLEYCPLDRILTDKEEGEVVIPMIAFIEGGMTLPMCYGHVYLVILIGPVVTIASLINN